VFARCLRSAIAVAKGASISDRIPSSIPVLASSIAPGRTCSHTRRSERQTVTPVASQIPPRRTRHPPQRARRARATRHPPTPKVLSPIRRSPSPPELSAALSTTSHNDGEADTLSPAPGRRNLSTPRYPIIPLRVAHQSRRRATNARPLLLLAAVLVALAPALPASAQNAPPTDAFEAYQGRLVRQLFFRSPAPEPGADPDAKAPELSERSRQLARNNVRLEPGVPFDVEILNDDIRRLNRLAVFSRVEIYT